VRERSKGGAIRSARLEHRHWPYRVAPPNPPARGAVDNPVDARGYKLMKYV